MQQTSLNNLFGAKDDGENGSEEGEEQAYVSKMNKKERKKYQKNKAKDRISTKDAKVLTGGVTLADNAELIKKMTNKVSAKSKKIKKATGGHEITKE